MKFEKCLAVACVLAVTGSSAQAVTIPATYIQQAESAISADSTVLSGWMTSQLKYAIPFNSTSGDVVPSQLKIFGFEAGVEGVVSGTKVDVNGFHALPTTLVNTNSIQMYSRLPLPMVLAHAKIGLPFGFDAGIRLGGIPDKTLTTDNTTFKIKNKVVGLDLRKKLIDEGALKPFGLTLGLSYTHADGSMDMNTSNVTVNNFTTNDGHTIQVQNGLVSEHADWKTNSVGLQAILDKKILIITPYIGVSTNYNSGNINNAITTSGTAVSPQVPGVSQALSATGSSADKPNKWDNRLLAGFELSILPFVKLGFGGEYAGSRNIAGDLGLRIQFR